MTFLQGMLGPLPSCSSTTPTYASVHSVLSCGPEMNEVTSLGISGTTITIANNEEGRRQEEKGRVSLISQLFMVGSKQRKKEGRL